MTIGFPNNVRFWLVMSLLVFEFFLIYANDALPTVKYSHCSDTSGTVVIWGKSYKTLKFCNQLWLAENFSGTLNLKYTQDSLSIKQALKLKIPSYKYFSDSLGRPIKNYSPLYNQAAAKLIENTLKGWRLPTTYEWNRMSSYVTASLISKATKFNHYTSFEPKNDPSEGIVNTSCFSVKTCKGLYRKSHPWWKEGGPLSWWSNDSVNYLYCNCAHFYYYYEGEYLPRLEVYGCGEEYHCIRLVKDLKKSSRAGNDK